MLRPDFTAVSNLIGAPSLRNRSGFAAAFADDANKTSVVFETEHHPGALALALTEFGLRGANLCRIESRPTDAAWRYRFFVDILHAPGLAGYRAVFEPPLVTLGEIHHLGTYRSAQAG